MRQFHLFNQLAFTGSLVGLFVLACPGYGDDDTQENIEDYGYDYEAYEDEDSEQYVWSIHHPGQGIYIVGPYSSRREARHDYEATEDWLEDHLPKVQYKGIGFRRPYEVALSLLKREMIDTNRALLLSSGAPLRNTRPPPMPKQALPRETSTVPAHRPPQRSTPPASTTPPPVKTTPPPTVIKPPSQPQPVAQTPATPAEVAVLKFLAVELETHIKVTTFSKTWLQRRDGWLMDVADVGAGNELAKLVVELEANLRWDPMTARWQSRRGAWIQTTAQAGAATAIAGGMLELEDWLTWHALLVDWGRRRDGWRRDVEQTTLHRKTPHPLTSTLGLPEAAPSVPTLDPLPPPSSSNNAQLWKTIERKTTGR